MNRRILTSSTSSSEKSALLAYQVLCQSMKMPVRKPVGRTFWPMSGTHVSRNVNSLRRRRLHPVGQGDVDVRIAALDRVGGAAGAGHDPLHDRAAVHARLDDFQVL